MPPDPNVLRLLDSDLGSLNDDYSIASALMGEEAIAVRARARVTPTQALVLLDDVRGAGRGSNSPRVDNAMMVF